MSTQEPPKEPRGNGELKEEVVNGVLHRNGEPVVVSKVERLEAENLHLRVLNLAGQIQTLESKIQDGRNKLDGLQGEIIKARDELQKKYDIDFAKYEIRESDGAVVQRGTHTSMEQLIKQQQTGG